MKITNSISKFSNYFLNIYAVESISLFLIISKNGILQISIKFYMEYEQEYIKCQTKNMFFLKIPLVLIYN